ncbi:phosphatidylserine/phosphatidylglycerophosphate/cardiolipin synthase family protein [bacterium]|nr:phosphatidylserine/phosphatidylglycerophosphate/cardiolipin synthase family protein [bacterium]
MMRSIIRNPVRMRSIIRNPVRMRSIIFDTKKVRYLLHLKFIVVCTIAACTRPQPVQSSGVDDLTPTLAESMPRDPVAQALESLRGLYNPWDLPPVSLPFDGLGNWQDAEIAHVRPGQDTLTTRMSILDFAQKSVRLQTFIMKGDETGQAFANKLIELVARGVDVQLLVDDANIPFKGAQNLFLYLTSHGVKVHGYRPVWMQLGNNANWITRVVNGGGGTGSNGAGQLIDFADRKNHRYHEKIMVVDAEIPGRGIVMMGGTNIANEYYNIQVKRDELLWRDQDIVVRGDGIVGDMARAFDANLADITEFNKNSSFSDAVESTVANARGVFGSGRAIGLDLDAGAMQRVAAASSRVVQLQWSRANARMIHHSPLKKEFRVEQRLLAAIASARREVILVNPYFIPSKEMMAALVAAARRGVRIQILTNSILAGDSPAVQEVGRMFYKNLMFETSTARGGPQSVPIEIHEWGGDPEFKNGYGTLHAKYAVFDRQLAHVGSFNLDPRSQVFNNEVVVETDDRLLVARLVEQYTRDSGPGFASIVTPQETAGYNAGTDLEKLRRKVLTMFKVFL